MTTPAGAGPVGPGTWSRRRRRTVAGLAAAAVVLGAGALALPARYGVSSGLLAALCALLCVAAVVVFLAVPGPGTLRTLLRSVPLAGSVLVVAVLILLSTDDRPLRWGWGLVAAGAAAWAGVAAWEARRSGRDPGD